jgi:hypothetical protein
MLSSFRNRMDGRTFTAAAIATLLLVFLVVVGLATLGTRSIQAQPPRLDTYNLMVRGYITARPWTNLDLPTAVGVRNPGKEIYLPGVEVYLSDPQTGKAGNSVKTDLSGRFTVFAPVKGRYHICWKSAVYGGGCEPGFVSAGGSPQFVSSVRIPLPARAGYVAIAGHVTDGDDRIPRAFDPFMNINAFATVTLEDGKNRPVEVYVNNFGDYLLPYVPAKQKLNLTATIESAKIGQEILPDAHIEGAPVNRVNLKFKNHNPHLDPLVAFDAAGHKRVQNAAPGSKIIVEAKGRDLDGDPVEYVWSVDDGQGKLLQMNGGSAEWQLPNARGRYAITVVAYDKKGGYDKAALSVLATGGGIPFGGVVVDPAGVPVKGAEIEIVGNPGVKTQANGRFQTLAKEAARYVFNIHKEGFALNSQIYDRGVVGGRWILHRADVVTVNPTQTIRLVHKRTERDCPGPGSMHAGLGVAGASLTIPEWQDGSGNAIDPPAWWTGPRKPQGLTTAVALAATRRAAAAQEKERQPVIMPRQIKLPPCGPGVSVEIPANSILDLQGNPATAPLKLSISTVDLLSPQQMPGDDSVIPKAGGGGSIESFGAGSLDMPSGFKLKPGATAKVSIPVDRSRLMSGMLPPSVPLLSYDETAGHWIEEGTLDLVTVAGKKSYVGTVKHFSPFNADNVKTSASACVRVFSPTLPTHYNLEVSAPYQGTGAPKVLTKQVDQDASGENVIYNLPNNVNVTLAPMTLGATPQLLGFYVVNSGPPQNPNTSPLAPPGPPFTSCNNFVVLKVGEAPSSPFGGEFLHGLGFIAAENLGFDDLTSAAPTGNALKDAIVQASKNYYSSVDPGGLRTTFVAFKSQNGLSADPSTPVAGEIVAQYANSGDLGFGRDMHCLKKANGDVACYVTNYGNGFSNIFPGDGTSDTDDAQAAETRSAVNFSHEVATVAMEYTVNENDALGPRVVKFYVYKKDFPNVGDYNRSISANLDGRGERPVPQLCMICHGGQVPQESGNPAIPLFGTTAQVNLHSRFLPFDYRFYTFADTAVPSRTAAVWKSTQDPGFQDLNQQIVNAAPVAPAADPIHELVTGLYSNGGVPPQAPNFVVPGWANGASANAPAQASFYTGVIANGCRGCHTAQPFSQLQFNTSNVFINVSAPSSPVPVAANNKLMLGTAQSRVCGDYTMPHALRTHDIFWNVYWDVPNWGAPPSPAFPAQFQNFGDGVGGSTWKSGLCTSFISSTVSNPSHFYEQSIQPVWSSKCVACHVSGGAAAFLNLTEVNSYATVVGGGLVTPGDDTAGALIYKISDPGLAQADRMPPGCFRAPEPPNSALPCVAQTDVDKIKAWIRSGAN